MATFTPENTSAAVDIRHLLPWVVIGPSGPIGTIGNIEINAGTAVVSDLQSATPVNYSGGTGLTGSFGDPSGGTFTSIARTGVGTLSGITPRPDNFAEIDGVNALRVLDGDDIISGSTVGGDFLFAGYDGGTEVLNGNGGGDNFAVPERLGTPSLTITGAIGADDTLFVWNNILTSAPFLDLRNSTLTSIDAITFDPGTRAIILAAQLGGSAISTTAVIGATSGSAFFDIVKQTDGGTVDASALTVHPDTLFRIFGTATGETITGDADGPTDLHPGAGIDTVNGGNGNDFFFVAGNEGEFDTLNGGGGVDTLTVEGTASLVLKGFNAAAASIEIFDGNGKGLLGNGNANVFNLAGLTGRSGLPFIDGGAGNDTITGSNFADVIVARGSEAFFDTFNGGTGADTLTVEGTASLVLNRFNAATESIEIFDGNGKGLLGNSFANVFNLAGLTGRSGLPFINGGAGKDTITGSKFADVIVASRNEAVFDVMNGGLGTDTLRVTGGASLILNGFNAAAASIEKFEGAGNALVGTGLANVFNLAGTTVTGLPFIDGGDGNDTITGNGVTNRIIGGRGADTMDGGTGLVGDIFDFNEVNQTGKTAATRDKIIGFQHARDNIDLSTIDATEAAAGDKFSFLATKGALFTGAKGQLRWFQEDRPGGTNDKTIVEGDVNGDKFPDFQIELKGLIALSAADFLL